MLRILALLTLSAFSAQAEIPILQGPTSESKTEIIILRKSSDNFRYEVSPDVSLEISSFAPTPSSWVVDSIKISAVNFFNSEALKIIVWQGSKKIDERAFNFIVPQDLMRVALLSCASDKFTSVGNKKPWESVKKTNPNLMLWLGDNVYAAYFDPINPTQFWNRFVETRRALGVFFWKDLVPSFAVWDDHDYGGGNNGDSSYDHRIEVARIFKAFFGSIDLGGEHSQGPGVSQSFAIGAHRFVMMDGRTFKTPSSMPSEERTLWGKEQFEWLKSIVETTKVQGQKLWLSNGTKFFDAEPEGESLEKDQPLQMQATAELLDSLLSQNLVTLVSGDAHFSEIIDGRIGGHSVMEITSSSIHSVRTPGSKMPETPSRRTGFYGDSFVVIELPTNEASGLRGVGYAARDAKEVFKFDF